MFRNYLIEMRKNQGLSQTKIAEKMGCVQSYYNAIEHGERQQNMDFSIMEALAAAFDVPLQTVIEAEGAYRKQRESA